MSGAARGVVAAGHPLTAEAGARALREGGNAVDAAVAAVLMSWVCESVLTGPGAGGFMLVHTPEGENALVDFFVAAPGLGLPADARAQAAALVPIDVAFTAEAIQRFHAGPASCGVPGNPAGVAHALDRFGSMPLRELTAPAARAARAGVQVNEMQGYLQRILGPIICLDREGAALYAPDGDLLGAGDTLRLPEVGDLLERLGEEGPRFLYEGDVAATIGDWVRARGGLLTREDLAAYRPIERAPARAPFRDTEVLTNPPPSSGGILIAYALDLLSRLDRQADPRTLVEVMERANRERTEAFTEGLHREGYLERFMARDALEAAAGELGSRLGSTTHIAVIDDAGGCASVTCSNGTCSGVVVPGTGMHLNNMLGEQDLNPHGFHRHRPGRRIPSMMAPTVVLRDGRPAVALGSAGSNRIRSAIIQTIVGIVDEGLPAEQAVARPRVHPELGVVYAEPGVAEDALAELELGGWIVNRWRERNLFFGGVQAVARDPATGELTGGGDPRRGGAAVVVRA